MKFKNIHSDDDHVDVRIYAWPVSEDRNEPRMHIGFGMGGASIGMSVTCSPEEARELANHLIELSLAVEQGIEGAA